MPADTPTPAAPLDLDARVPCASCGGEFHWTIFDGEVERLAVASADCRCGVAWYGVTAPVTWRTLASTADEVPAAYVARLVGEVERLTAERDELADRVQVAGGTLELGGIQIPVARRRTT